MEQKDKLFKLTSKLLCPPAQLPHLMDKQNIEYNFLILVCNLYKTLACFFFLFLSSSFNSISRAFIMSDFILDILPVFCFELHGNEQTRKAISATYFRRKASYVVENWICYYSVIKL